MRPDAMKLTLGPVLFNWEPGAWRDFHFRIADEAPVDTVVVGEAVCSKRMPFFAEHMPAVIGRLQDAGKEVLLASLALVTLERERRWTAELAASETAMVEANDVSALAHLAGRQPRTLVHERSDEEVLTRLFNRRVLNQSREAQQ